MTLEINVGDLIVKHVTPAPDWNYVKVGYVYNIYLGVANIIYCHIKWQTNDPFVRKVYEFENHIRYAHLQENILYKTYIHHPVKY